MTAGLTRTAALVALGRASGTASLLAVNAILARAWPVEQVGAWAAVWILGSAVVPLFLLGLPTTVLYLFPRRDAVGRSALLFQVAGVLALSGLLLVLLLWAAGPAALRWLDPRALADLDDLGALLGPFLPYLFALVCGGFVDAALVAAGRAGWQAGLALAGAVGLVLAAAAGVWLGLGVKAVLLLVSGIGILRLAAGLVLAGLAAGSRPGAERLAQGGRELLACALPVWLTDAVGGLSRYVDRFVVTAFFPVAVLAQYQLAAVEVPVSLLLGAVVTVLVPRVSGLYQEGRVAEIAVLWQQAVGRLALLVLPLFAFLFCFAGPFMAVYLPESYAPGVWVFRIYLLALPVRCAVYGPVLVGIGRARWAAWASLLDLGINATLGIGLVHLFNAGLPAWAFLGPALAAVTATWVQVIVLVGAIASALGWGWRLLLPWARILRLVVLSAGTAGIAFAVTAGLDPAGVRLVVGAAVFAALSGVLLRFSDQDRAEVTAVLRSLRGSASGD